MSGDAHARPAAGGQPQTVARVIAAGAGARRVRALPGCCPDWPYPALAIAIMGALVWGAVVFRVTAAFLAAAMDGSRPRVSRAAVAVLGVLVAAIGAEAFLTLATAAPEPLVGPALEVSAAAWIACCGVLVVHRWRQPATADRDT